MSDHAELSPGFPEKEAPGALATGNTTDKVVVSVDQTEILRILISGVVSGRQEVRSPRVRLPRPDVTVMILRILFTPTIFVFVWGGSTKPLNLIVDMALGSRRPWGRPVEPDRFERLLFAERVLFILECDEVERGLMLRWKPCIGGNKSSKTGTWQEWLKPSPCGMKHQIGRAHV